MSSWQIFDAGWPEQLPFMPAEHGGACYYEDYASVQALALVNATITYTDNHGIRRQNTMSLPDVIELASNVREITIPTKETDPKFYTEYFGRRFRYTEVIGGVEETFEVYESLPGLVEEMEIPEAAFYLGVQYHPEFKSRPDKAHPLFSGFIKSCCRT